jgi:hypothetical protein
MPASRILEGSLPERRPKAQIFSGAQPQLPTQPQRDIKGESPCLVSALDVSRYSFLVELSQFAKSAMKSSSAARSS